MIVTFYSSSFGYGVYHADHRAMMFSSSIHARGTIGYLLVSISRLHCAALAISVQPGARGRCSSCWSGATSSGRSCSLLNLAVMESAPGHQQQQHELLLIARFPEDREDANCRLKSLSSAMEAKHHGRVAVQEDRKSSRDVFVSVSSRAAEVSEDAPTDNSCAGLPAFQIVRSGLVIDEYHVHGDELYAEEVHKRVDAALSLSRQDDCSTLKGLWSPDVAGEDYRDEMSVATYAVQVASTVARELQEELCHKGAISKTDSSPVTVGDFSVQAIVLHVLDRYFPGYGFIAEETSSVLRQDPASLAAVLEVVRKVLHPDLTEAELCAAIDLGGRGHGTLARERGGRGGRTWVLDPIDGTKGFLRGEQFCVALGLLESGKAVVGILGCPNLPTDQVAHPEGSEAPDINGNNDRSARGLIYSAALGEGTFVRALSAGGEDTRRVMVNHARRPCETRVLESVEAGHTRRGVACKICEDVGIEQAPIRIDSQCKYGLLAQGQGGIYLRLPRWGYVENIWDHVAGAVVIREAGGKVTDSRGMPLDFSLGTKLSREVVGVVATSGRIHAEMIRAVHNRQVEDWARVVAEAKRRGCAKGGVAPPLPGVDWTFGIEEDPSDGLSDEWWASAVGQRQPLAMRTSGMFYSALRRGWDKLVAVLFHGSWTQESQHAVGVFQQLAARQHEGFGLPPPNPAHDTKGNNSDEERAQTAAATTAGGGREDGGSDGEGDTPTIFLAEADVMSLIDVADRQAIGTLPSVHLHLGGREVVRLQVEHDESPESLGGRIAEVARWVRRAAVAAEREAASSAR